MNPITKSYLSMTISTRRAFWMGIVYGLMLLGFFFMLYPELADIHSIQHGVSIITPLVVSVLVWIGVGLIFFGRAQAGGQIVIYSTIVGMMIVALMAQGYGPTVAAVVVLIVSVIATQTQEEKTAQYMIGAAFTAAALILLIDSLWPFYRVGIEMSDVMLARILALILAIIFCALVIGQFNSFPLTTKLIILTLALTLIPMAAVGYASTSSSQEALINAANQSQIASAAQVAASLDNFVTNNLDALRTEAQIGDIVELLELPPDQRPGSEVLDSTNDILTAFKQKNPVFITSYAVFDRHGTDVADTEVSEVGLAKVDRDYFRQPRNTGLPYVSEVRTSPVTGGISIYFSAPIRNSAGEFLGILRVRYDANILQQLVINQGGFRGKEGLAMVVSGENVLLAHTSDPELIFRSIVPLTEEQVAQMQQDLILPTASQDPYFVQLPGLAESIVPEKLGQGFNGEFHIEKDLILRTRERANAVRMKTLPWTVVVAQQESVLLASVNRQERGNMFVAIIAAVLSVLVGSVVARYLAQPIVNLTGVAKQLAAGDLQARAAVSTRDEIGTLAGAFNQMAGQLNSLVTGLEQRVSDRTKALVTSAEVSRRLSTILKQDELVAEVVTQLQRAFDYYHVHIYLFDPEQANLVMAGGTGEAGQVMLSRGHKLPRGHGLVGRAADTGIPVLVPDVTRAEGWLPNPLLPDTKSELAVPIILGDRVLGVLDVQQNRVEGLKQEDVDLLLSISNQVAVGLQNARAYAETRRRADREAMISAIGQRIQRTISTEEALKVAVREIGHALGTASTVQLGARPVQQNEPGNGAAGGQKNGQAN